MEILIDGSHLDIYDKGISYRYDSLRFADAIADTYSTDIELPRTKNNVAILGAYGELDRGQLFGKRIDATIMIEQQYDGYIQVTRTTDSIIYATAFLSYIPSKLVDVDIHKMLCVDHYDGNASMTWDGSINSYSLTINDYELKIYNDGVKGMDNGTNYHQYSTSVALDSMLQAIGSYLGITINAPATEDANHRNYLIGLGNRLDPRSKYMLTFNTDTPLLTYYKPVYVKESGQSVFAEYDHNTNDGIVVNRACTLGMDCDFRCNSSFNLAVYKNGNLLTSNNSTSVGGYHTVSLTNVNINGLADGDAITFRAKSNLTNPPANCVVGGAVALKCLSTYLTQEDYNVRAKFVHRTNYHPTFAYVKTDGTAVSVATTIADGDTFCKTYVYGSFAGLTLKDLLTSICWATDTKVQMSGNTLSFVSATQSKTISADLESCAYADSHLYKSNNVVTPDGESTPLFTLTNDYLEDEGTVHESCIYRSINAPFKIKQWGITIDNILPTFYQRIEQGVGIGVCSSGSGQFTNVISTYLGMSNIAKCLMVKGKTFDAISGYDYLDIDGHRYMLVGYDYDVDSQQYNFEAFEI